MKKKKLVDEVFWIELGPLPIKVGYSPSWKARTRALKKLRITNRPSWEESDGRCEHWWNVGKYLDHVVLITLSTKARRHEMPYIAGVIAHECMHAWRHIREAIGEKEPSSEFEAYTMQQMVQHVLHAHMTRRKKPWKDHK